MLFRRIDSKAAAREGGDRYTFVPAALCGLVAVGTVDLLPYCSIHLNVLLDREDNP